MEPIIQAIAKEPELLIPILAIPSGLVIALFAIACRTGNIKERERTRREVAAYVAEGTIAPDDAERLLTVQAPGKCIRKA
ncbi:MAG: hypothetical protein KDA20_05530 [Phycisphaerales bacterium]|nr:hypothetical protein [Phycisphaerales bacterium]